MNTPLIVPTEQLLEKALGAYLGFACGDALGATVEFMTPKAIQKQYGIHKDIIGGGWLRLPEGHVTDDTEMALTLGQALIDAQGWNLHTVADHFVTWLSSNPPDIGDTCLRGIRRYKNTGELSGPENEHEAGNGACMRILPLILATLHKDDVFNDWICEHNHLTHNNPKSDQASISLGRMVKHLLKDERHLVQYEVDQLVKAYPEFAFSPYPGKTSGYIVDTLQTVLHFFFNSNNFEDCVVQTVNRGGDADTTGALVGMLAGAKYGVRAIPERWLLKLDQTVHHHIRQQTSALLKLAEKLAQER